MNISVNPWYYCNFNCDFCYLTKEQLKDKKLLDLNILEERILKLKEREKIEKVDIYGGEISLLPKNYFFELKDVFKKNIENVEFNLITNLSVINDIILDEECFISVSYDFDCREKNDIVWKNMCLLENEFSVLMLASPCLVKKEVDSMIKMFNLIKNIESVEVKPYSKNQSNQYNLSFKEFEEFVKKWIESKVEKKFVFVNEELIKETLRKERNSFSDDHIYITPSGNYAVLEFDLNDNEFFLEYDDLQDYYKWCAEEKNKVEKNKFCSNCEYFGNCLSEHLRVVKDLDSSCNGFKHLISWYSNRELKK